MRPLTVLSVTSEIYPLIKTGGLADVAGALPGALAGEGVAMTTLVPGYPAVMTALAAGEEVHAFETLFGGSARLIRGTAQELDLFVLDAPHLYDRPGLPYLAPDGRDWPDNALRFAALARAAAELGRGLVPGFEPDVIHGHDWQAGLTPAYLRFSGATGPATVMTVHNIAFQGVFPSGLLPELGLPWSAYTIDGVEYYGQIGFLKAGLQLADRITTVSPTYASEIQTREGGVGLDGLLRARSEVVSGILNGIDERVWNPAADPLIAAAFDAGSLEARQLNKAALQERLGLRADPEALLFGAVSRLSEQKGLDLVLAALPTLLADGGQLALLGAGDRILEERFRSAARDHPGQVGCVIGYDEALAHQIQAGADALLVPSRFEPCGLTQLCAMRYGNVPVVSRVGGLADTVIDANEAAVAAGVGTGVQFAPVGPAEFARSVTRTRALYRDREAWKRVQRNGMTLDLGWSRPARHYANLYRSCL